MYNPKEFIVHSCETKDKDPVVTKHPYIKSRISQISCLTSKRKSSYPCESNTFSHTYGSGLKDTCHVVPCEVYSDVYDKESCHMSRNMQEEDINRDSGISSGSGSTNSSSSKETKPEWNEPEEDLMKVPWFVGSVLR